MLRRIDDVDRGSLVLDFAAARSLVGAMLDAAASHSHGGFFDRAAFGSLGRGNGLDCAARRIALGHVGDTLALDFVLAMFGEGMGHLSPFRDCHRHTM
jgi:hypothetical protein